MINGSTGNVAFDDNGDRINAEYDIVNVQSNQTQISVGQYHFSFVSTTENIVLGFYILCFTVNKSNVLLK